MSKRLGVGVGVMRAFWAEDEARAETHGQEKNQCVCVCELCGRHIK